MSFQELENEHKTFLLEARGNVGSLEKIVQGLAGQIFKFRSGATFPQFVCAKVPTVSATRSPDEAARRFLREMKLQRRFFYHQFVHWPFSFQMILDTPVAWFRYWTCDLSDLIEDQTVSDVARLGLLVHLIEGLLHCHARGLVAHQDLKPENVFVRDYRSDMQALEGEIVRVPKLADFGSANLASEIGEFGGTRPYMAPEQWTREPLGQHTSVWSIGLIGYELMSRGLHPMGQPTRPWRVRSSNSVWRRWQSNTMWRRWMDDGCPLGSALPDPDLDEIFRSCLSTDAQDRPSLEELQAYLMSAIAARSQPALQQVDLLSHYASLDKNTNPDWPHLDARLASMEREIEQMFP
ncbi:serine/threonine protein kinase [Brevundimonas vesicularis]|uniref:non-specific serine/threonine protein kinase n=1 Tax=Brevundimonas vesicularis TaxID=41276 RepID=A0ABU4KTD6_BREVE|nr:protein kinase [Brevundimonas vesicularis]MDX2336261.1 protein kinase [Brevundimonas vesicularis]